MGKLDGRTAVVTGAGRGLGREHALLLAAEGASVVVNDVGVAADGTGNDSGPAAEVVAEITAAGGRAVTNGDDISTWDGAQRLIEAAVQTFGSIDILVNNAGILRDRTLANMTEDDWDAVMAVHLKGHFLCSRFAMAHWRELAKAGTEVKASVINTSSIAGLAGQYGQANYGAAKAGIAALTIIAAQEGARYGVRTNAVAPLARTRLTLSTPRASEDPEAMQATDPDAFDFHSPANVSPLVAYLAMADCPVNGAVFHVGGNQIGLFSGWELSSTLENDGRWEIDELETAVPKLCSDKVEMASVRTDMGDYRDAIMRAVER